MARGGITVECFRPSSWAAPAVINILVQLRCYGCILMYMGLLFPSELVRISLERFCLLPLQSCNCCCGGVSFYTAFVVKGMVLTCLILSLSCCKVKCYLLCFSYAAMKLCSYPLLKVVTIK